MTLRNLFIGQTGEVLNVESNIVKKRRFLDLGLCPGTNVKALQKSPSGDPIAYFIRGTVVALRNEDAEQIIIKKTDL